MNRFTLRRIKWGPTGCFSYLVDEMGRQLAVTASRVYQAPDGEWHPKTPPGQYVCKLGAHSLDGKDPLLAFEILNVPSTPWCPGEHTGILFHPGNFPVADGTHPAESNGCELVGMSFGILREGGSMMDAVLGSQQTFHVLMDRVWAGMDEFSLTVE